MMVIVRVFQHLNMKKYFVFYTISAVCENKCNNTDLESSRTYLCMVKKRCTWKCQIVVSFGRKWSNTEFGFLGWKTILNSVVCEKTTLPARSHLKIYIFKAAMMMVLVGRKANSRSLFIVNDRNVKMNVEYHRENILNGVLKPWPSNYFDLKPWIRRASFNQDLMVLLNY